MALGLTWRRADAYRAFAAIALFTVFLGSYVTMSLVWESFAYYENSYSTLNTLKARTTQSFGAQGTASGVGTG